MINHTKRNNEQIRCVQHALQCICKITDPANDAIATILMQWLDGATIDNNYVQHIHTKVYTDAMHKSTIAAHTQNPDDLRRAYISHLQDFVLDTMQYPAETLYLSSVISSLFKKVGYINKNQNILSNKKILRHCENIN